MNKDFNVTNYHAYELPKEGSKSFQIYIFHEYMTTELSKKNHNKLSAINIATPAFYHYSSLARGKGERIYVTCLHRVHTGHPEFSLTFSNKPCNFIILITGIVYPSFTCSWLKLYMSGSLKNWALPEWQ